MSEKYSIGEVAKKLEITPRAIRYYEQKNLITPASIGKNGYRYYQQEQINRLELINYLRKLGFTIKQIKSLLNAQGAPESLQLLFQKQIIENKRKISLLAQQQKQLERLNKIVNTQKINLENFTDIAKIMKKEPRLIKLRNKMWLFGFGILLIEVSGILSAYQFYKSGQLGGIIMSIVIMLVLVVCLTASLTKYYYSRVRYICPNCGTKFSPSLVRFIFSPHTPKFRKLMCPKCHHKSYCLEIAR